MRRSRNRLLAACLAVLVVAPWGRAHATPRGEAAPYLLIEVMQVLRGPAPAELETRRARIVEQLESARTDSARCRIERALAELDERLERSRSYVLDGWSSPARKDGSVTTSTKSQRTVLLPASSRVNTVLADLEQGDLFLVDAESARDLFTSEGRRYTRAASIRRAETPAIWRAATVRQPVPDSPDPEGAPGAVLSIGAPRVSDHDGHAVYRYSVSIEAPPNTGSGRVLRVWYHVYVRTLEGEVIGPLPTAGEYVDREGEGVAIHRSWEIIRLEGGPALSRDAARLEVIATRWSNRMAS